MTDTIPADATALPHLPRRATALNIAIAAAARELESAVCDLAAMAGVTTAILEHFFDVTRDKQGYVRLTESQVERALFCAYQTAEMAGVLKASYYAAIDQKLEDGGHAPA